MATRTCSETGCELVVAARGLCRSHYGKWNRANRDQIRPADLRTRIERNIQVNEATGCWEWTAHINPEGYGITSINRRLVRAHRAMYEIHVGSIPDGLQLDHLCRVRHCVNPTHLEPVTPAENQRRGIGAAGMNYRKTHCPQGHPYDEANTYVRAGGRQCKTCHRDLERQRYRARQGLPVVNR